MAFSRRTSGRGTRRGEAAKEERALFPLLSLIAIALCVGLWTYGAKLYQDQMAVYDSYTAVRQAVSSDRFFEGVSVEDRKSVV